jgi:signal transduction histidine kinase
MCSIMVAVYSLGTHADARSALTGVGLALATVAGAQAAAPPSGYSAASSFGLFTAFVVLAPFGVGRVVRSREAVVRRLHDARSRLHKTGAVDDEPVLAEERARLARSLETGALAGLDAMAEHASADTLDRVRAIEDIARQALGEVRSLLVDLRGRANPEPAPSLGELRARVEAALAVGGDPLPRTTDVPVPLPEGWSLLTGRWINRALVALGLIYGAAMMATTLAHGHRLPVAASMVAIIMGVAVAFLRRAPLAATAASAAAAVAYSATVHPVHPVSGLQPTAVLVLAPFALGAWEWSPLRMGIGLALCFVALFTTLQVAPLAGSIGPLPAFVAGSFAIGAVLQSRARTVAELADAALGIDQARKQRTATAKRAERDKTARELHDALAHSLTVILLQATAAGRVWHSDPDRAAEHATALRTTLAETGTELRQLVVALAAGQDIEMSLDQVPTLIERARASGLDVAVHMNRPPNSHGLGPCEAAAYRIVQEALTNAARHAPGSAVTVEISCTGGELRVSVTNGPAASDARPASGGQHGLDGMRERARACGGRLATAHLPDGGFRVEGRLPWTTEPRLAESRKPESTMPEPRRAET